MGENWSMTPPPPLVSSPTAQGTVLEELSAYEWHGRVGTFMVVYKLAYSSQQYGVGGNCAAQW